jgi:hypothetical protein
MHTTLRRVPLGLLVKCDCIFLDAGFGVFTHKAELYCVVNKLTYGKGNTPPAQYFQRLRIPSFQHLDLRLRDICFLRGEHLYLYGFLTTQHFVTLPCDCLAFVTAIDGLGGN